MDEPIPDHDNLLSLQWSAIRRWNNDDREFDPLNFLIGIGALLTLILLLLIAMQFAIVDPEIRFGLLLFGLGIAAIALIGRSYISKNRPPIFVREDHHHHEEMNALQTTLDILDQAFEGIPFSQMLALQELKDLLIDHLVLNNHMSRSEVEYMASDPIWMEAEIDHAELRTLLATDLKQIYAPELSGSVEQKELIAAFPIHYRKILEQLEEI